MRVAVLGCNGAMGSYFTDFFLKGGHDVVGSDLRRQKPRSTKRSRFASSNSDAVEGADLVLIAVPVRLTAEVVREIAPRLKGGCTLVEITSVKSSILPELTKTLEGSGATLLSIHPLFGPDSVGPRPKICVVGSAREMKTVHALFPKAELLRFTIEQHDRSMAYVLTLVHAMNIVFAAAVVGGPGLKEFERTAPPTANKQMEIAKSVLRQDPALYSYIEAGNPFSIEALDSALARFAELRKVVASGDEGKFEGGFSAISKELGLH